MEVVKQSMTDTLVEKEILSEDWAEKLRPFIDSPEFARIMNVIRSKKSVGVNVYPAAIDTFRAFNMCPVDNVKVILGLQDPYHQPWGKGCVADGIPMSCSYSGRYEPSLKHFNEAIKETTKRETDIPFDLSYLSYQGVLMLNKSLTVEHLSPNSMQGLWDKFHDFLFENVINFIDHPVVYMLMGGDAKWFTRYARMNDPIVLASHPASAAYSGGKWDHKNIFNVVNQNLTDYGQGTIKW